VTRRHSRDGRGCRRPMRRVLHPLPTIYEPEPGAREPLEVTLRSVVHEVREASNLLVLRTKPGGAERLAPTMEAKWPEVMAAIAGRDLLILVTASAKTCGRLGKMIRELMG